MPRLSRNDTALSIQKDHSLIVSRVAVNISQAELWMSQYARDPSRSVIGPMKVMRRRPHRPWRQGPAPGSFAQRCGRRRRNALRTCRRHVRHSEATVAWRAFCYSGLLQRNACLPENPENPPTPHQGEAVIVSVASVLSGVKGKPPETFCR